MVTAGVHQISTTRMEFVAYAQTVVEYTFFIDKPFDRAHRKDIAAAFGKCAGLAIPPVTYKKGGK